MKNMMMKTLLVTLISILGTSSAFAATACTPYLKVKELKTRGAGYTIPVLEGLANTDIKECGRNNHKSLIFNFKNTEDRPHPDGQKMLLRQLELAFAMQLDVSICSTGCDSQYPTYSSISHVRVKSKDTQ